MTTQTNMKASIFLAALTMVSQTPAFAQDAMTETTTAPAATMEASVATEAEAPAPAAKEEAPKAEQAAVELPSWLNDFEPGADFRYRHEWIKKDDGHPRNRHRVRARLSLAYKASDEAKIKVRLATGSTDPVSTNQTLDGGLSTKGFNLDRAYVELTPEILDGLKITLGKSGTKFYKPGKSDLTWDGDLAPEGGVAAYTIKSGDTKVEVLGAGIWIEERSSEKDSFLLSGQAVLNQKMGKSKLSVGAGYHHYTKVEGFEPFYDVGDSFGNTLAADGTYDNKFQIIEAGFDYSVKISDIPVGVNGDFVLNIGADDDKLGFLAGLKVGKAKKPGDLEFGYNFRRLEKDAVIGAFSDSDISGGGTDLQGHKASIKVGVVDAATLGLTYTNSVIGLEDKTPYQRGQLDLVVKF